MHRFLALLSLLALSACDPSESEKAHMAANLPAGCVLRDLGSWGDIEHVVMVLCDGRKTTSMNYQQRRWVGRAVVQVPVASVQID